MIRSCHWKILLVLFPIIGTCAYGQPAPGGQGGFLGAWWGVSSLVPPSDYLHYWNFSKNQNANDDAGGMNGTASGVTINTNGAIFPTYAAPTFETYIALPGPITNSVSAFSITIWAKPDTTAMANNGFGGWMLNDRNPAGSGDFQLFYSTTTNWYFDFISSNNTFFSLSTGGITNNAWQHISLTVNQASSNISMYINGTLKTNRSFTGSIGNRSTGSARIGNLAWSSPSADLQYEGQLDKIRFYNRNLSDIEVLRIYQSEQKEKGLQ